MINDLAAASPGTGFVCFDTGGMIPINPDCSIDVMSSNKDGDGAFSLLTPGGLPAAAGLQTLTGSFGAFGTGASVVVAPFFGGTLDITAVTPVPEPASVAPLSLGMAAVGWTLRKRPGALR
jgi:hypothetical protein